MRHIPLRWFREVIVPLLREVPLLPQAAVDRRDIIPREPRDGVSREIGNDGIGVFAGVTHDICHWRLPPVFVNLRVALLAGLRTDIVRRI